MPLAWTIMSVLGFAMVAIFLYIRYAPYRKLGLALGANDGAAGAASLGVIRTGVAINLAQGVLVLVVTLLR